MKNNNQVVVSHGVKNTSKAKPAQQQKLEVMRPSPLSRTPFGGFPLTSRATLKYCDVLTVNAPAGLAGGASYRANSIFDPDETGTGHQPMGYDTFALIYGVYCVLSSRMRITAVASGNTGALCACGIGLDDDGVIGTPSTSTLIERGGYNYKYYKDSSSCVDPVSVTASFDATKWFGKKYTVDDPNMSALIGANAGRSCRYIVFVGPLDASSDLSTTTFSVEIEFDCLFSMPKDQSSN